MMFLDHKNVTECNCVGHLNCTQIRRPQDKELIENDRHFPWAEGPGQSISCPHRLNNISTSLHIHRHLPVGIQSDSHNKTVSGIVQVYQIYHLRCKAVNGKEIVIKWMQSEESGLLSDYQHITHKIFFKKVVLSIVFDFCFF